MVEGLDFHSAAKDARMTFNDRKFIVADPAQLLSRAFKDKFLYNHASKSWETSDVKKAYLFLAIADSKARRVIGRYYILKLKVAPNYSIPEGEELTLDQIKALDFMLVRNRSYLALRPGMGKTVICSVALNSIQEMKTHVSKALIVSPKSAITHWARTLVKWSTKELTPDDIFILKSSRDISDLRPGHPVVIVPDSLIASDVVFNTLMTHKFLWGFFDEAHRFKGLEARRSSAVYGEFKSQNKKENRIYNRGVESRCRQVASISGSPTITSAMDWYPVLISQCPSLIDFMSYTEFGKIYSNAEFNGFGYNFRGTRNAKLLEEKLQDFKFFAEKTGMPKKIRQIVYLNESGVKPETFRFSREVLANVTLAKILTEMVKVNLPPSKFLDKSIGARLAKALTTVSESKLEPAIEYIKSVLETSASRLIIFTKRRSTNWGISEALKLAGHDVVRIYGGQNADERELSIFHFQNSETARCIVINIEAGGTAITLTRSDWVIFAEFDWSDEINKQAEDRAHRIGQRNDVLCEYLALPNTIDEYVLKIVMDKEKELKPFYEGNKNANA